MILCILSENAFLGNCLIFHVTFLPKSTSDDVLDFSGLSAFLSQMFNSKYFLSWEEKRGKVILVSSGGNYQYQGTLIFCFCMGDWQKYLKYEAQSSP